MVKNLSIEDDRIVNKYKINRCIHTKNLNKKETIRGGRTFWDNIPSYKQTLYIIYIFCSILFLLYLRFVQKFNFISLGLISALIILLAVIIVWTYDVSSGKESWIDSIFRLVIGDKKKKTQLHSIIFFTIIVFIVFTTLYLTAILLIYLIEGGTQTSLKDLKLDTIKPLNILPDNLIETKNLYDRLGTGQNPQITVDKDYFDINNFIKPGVIEKEGIVSQDAGIIFNPNNPGAPGAVAVPQAGAPAASLINIGTSNNNSGSIFDNRIKVVEKDIYNVNNYFRENPGQLRRKLEKYFRYIYDKTTRSHLIIFKLNKSDIVNTPYGTLF